MVISHGYNGLTDGKPCYSWENSEDIDWAMASSSQTVSTEGISSSERWIRRVGSPGHGHGIEPDHGSEHDVEVPAKKMWLNLNGKSD